MNWMNHIEEMISKLSAACYVVRLMVHISNINSEINLLCILSLYYNKRKNFWGGDSPNSGKIFTLQKEIVRIMAGAQPKTSCISLLKQLDILLPLCQYILSLMRFVTNNQFFKQIHRYTTKIQGISTISQTKCQNTFKKNTFYTAIKIFNSLPHSLKSSRMTRQNFKQP